MAGSAGKRQTSGRGRTDSSILAGDLRWRTPHIHFKIKKGAKDLLTTQCYVKGEAGNDRDGVYRNIRDEKARAAVTVDFTPLEGSRIGEVTARFDIILGVTPDGWQGRGQVGRGKRWCSDFSI